MQSKNIRLIVVCTGLFALLLGWTSPASALPVFARKYGFECTMCHSHVPRLNDFGQRYRMNGYQLPGRENEEKTVLESPTPIALRSSAGYNYNVYENVSTPNLRQFQINGLDLLSGGLLGENIGYLLVYPPPIAADRGVAGQSGTIEIASVVFSNLCGNPWLNLRVGRFEPAYVAFSVKRSLTVSPYEIYHYAFDLGPAFSQTQEGIELTGYHRSGFAYALGVVNGSAGNPNDETNADFYARLQKVFGAGEGQTAGQRIGLVGYFGSAYPDPSLAPAGAADPEKKNFYRLGVDASLNFWHFNLGLQYLLEQDSQELWNLASDVTTNGGFAELSFLPTTNCVGFARYDLVDTPAEINQDLMRMTVGGRYYFMDNLAWHLELARRTVNNPAGGDDEIENFITTRLEFAF